MYVHNAVAIAIGAAHEFGRAGDFGAEVFGVGNAVAIGIGAALCHGRARLNGALVFAVNDAVAIEVGWGRRRRFVEDEEQADAVLQVAAQAAFGGEAVLRLSVEEDVLGQAVVQTHTHRKVEGALAQIQVFKGIAQASEGIGRKGAFLAGILQLKQPVKRVDEVPGRKGFGRCRQTRFRHFERHGYVDKLPQATQVSQLNALVVVVEVERQPRVGVSIVGERILRRKHVGFSYCLGICCAEMYSQNNPD